MTEIRPVTFPVSPLEQGIIEDISQDEPAAARVIQTRARTRTTSQNFVDLVLKPAGITRILDVVDIPLIVTRATGPIPR